jgi:hypothetical protein
VHEAAAAIREHGLGLKAATITPEGRGDVGSPNRILREEIGGKVIVRTGRRIPGVAPLGGVHAPISIVRMAVGDAYGAKEWREGEGDDEVAFRTERIERRICHAVAEFAFRQAERTGAKVFGGPKYTVSPTYEGMLGGDGCVAGAIPSAVRAVRDHATFAPFCPLPRPARDPRANATDILSTRPVSLLIVGSSRCRRLRTDSSRRRSWRRQRMHGAVTAG